MRFDYFYGSEAEQFSFFRIPKLLMTDPVFAGLSIEAKFLYGLLLDRMGISRKNKWLDEQDRVYIIYQVSEIAEDMGVSEKLAMKYLKELEAAQLLEKKRRGLGFPSLLYIRSFLDTHNREVQEKSSDTGSVSDEVADEDGEESTETDPDGIEEDVNSRGSHMGSSRTSEIAVQELPVQSVQEVPVSSAQSDNYGIKNNINNTNMNPILSNPIVVSSTLVPDRMGSDRIREKSEAIALSEKIEKYRALIRRNIDYDALVHDNPFRREFFDGIVELILEVVVSRRSMITVAGTDLPTEVVKSRLLKLNHEHIEYVVTSLEKTTTDIKNIKKYLLSALYNAPVTMQGYYDAWVQHDEAKA